METALLKVKSDILQHLDNRCCVILVMLDLSPAFDTVDHQLLLQRLTQDFGLSGTVLAWLKSYLTDRTQSMMLISVKSSVHNVPCGVPQGSVLGPMLFTCYTSPLGTIARKYNVSFHCYADDMQLYVPFQPGNLESEASAVSQLQDCLSEIKLWMLHNKLKLNDSKTELLLLGKQPHLHKCSISFLTVGDSTITPSSTVRNLGFHLDSSLTMGKHIAAVCKSSWFYLKNIRAIRKYLTMEDTQTLIHAFVSSRLDFCNSLLFGTSATLISQLQLVQNAAARIVSKAGKYEHVSPILHSLHWLPVHYRIIFKVLLTVYKAVHGLSAGYLSDQLAYYEPSRNLRSSAQYLLKVPRMNLVTCGDNSFYACGPKLWNRLPLFIRTSSTVDIFKSRLKTHLFAKCF